jgi:predicted GNAT superfamily acetyltransferase
VKRVVGAAGGVDSDAGVTIRALRGDDELRAAVALQRLVWGERFEEIVPRALLWIGQRIGGVAAGAFDERGELIGLVFGLTGIRHGQPVHWSDLLAVHPDARGRGISIALKAYQRAELLRLGVESVGWTFDPLESRNAHINFARLGIVAREYLRDLYGDGASSPLHAALGTDRLVADWRIASERVTRRLDGRERAPTAAETAALPRINVARRVADGIESREPDLELDAPRLRLAIPADIQMLKRVSPELARAWRLHTRAAFETYLARDYRVEELVRVGETSDYVLAATP